MATTQNYVIGRGKIYFGRFVGVTQEPAGELYLGNTPGFSLTVTRDELKHFNADSGIREQDDSADLQVNRSGKLECDNISAENLALFFFGDDSVLDNASPDNITDEAHDGVIPGQYVQLGTSEATPSGVRGVSAVTVSNDASPGDSYSSTTDYTLDAALGRIYIKTADEGGTIAEGTNLLIDYTVDATHRSQVISGNTPIEGVLRYVADNPKGTNRDFFFPWVKLTPNGDFNLKGDDWTKIPFNLDVLKREGYEAIYVDGRPVVNA